ncbi:MAG: putative damage-inducible protein DinB [Rhodothermales bacterium]|jgi:uncharacterized damage-inducible protein DinB
MKSALLSVLLVLSGATAASAQTDVRDEMLRHFDASMQKVVSLSEAMPSDLYDWAPAEGLMTVAEVYAHIARYNFMYLEDNLDVPVPEGVDLETMESLSDKETIGDLLVLSVAHVREQVGALSADTLSEFTSLYGRDVPKWAVLTQLVAHMNEHVGQSVAYARFNGVVPPWSR